MKSFLRKTATTLAGLFLGLGLAGIATAQQNIGFNPSTSMQGFPGIDISVGTAPTVTGCNTSAPTVVGGPTTGKITTVGTTTGCAVVLTFTIPALLPNQVAPAITGLFCWLTDLTTVADLFTEASSAYTAPTATASGSLSCTFTSRSISSGDVLLYADQGF